MRTYLSTIGYHETRVTRPVVKHGVDAGDRVVLVRPAEESDTERAADAVGYVTDMLGEIEPDVSVTTEHVGTGGFGETVLQCSEMVRAVEPDRQLVVTFGGGAREVLLPLLVASVLHAPRVDHAYQYTDVGQAVRPLAVPDLTAPVPSRATDTFAAVVERGPGVSLSELAVETDRSKSTVARHLDDLVDAGHVETSTEDGARTAAVTETGRLVHRARVARD